MDKAKYKVGDMLICINGFEDGLQGEENPMYGGAGYKPGKVFVVNNIVGGEKERWIYFPEDGGSGVFENALMTTYKISRIKLNFK